MGTVADVGRQQMLRGLALTAHAGLSGVASGAHLLLPMWPVHGLGTCDTQGIAVRQGPWPLALRQLELPACLRALLSFYGVSRLLQTLIVQPENSGQGGVHVPEWALSHRLTHSQHFEGSSCCEIPRSSWWRSSKRGSKGWTWHTSRINHQRTRLPLPHEKII